MSFSFRGRDEWKSFIATLPENAFFEIVRSALGPVRTPFSKQNLLADLCAFLSREDTREAIADYIDTTDRALIAAIALLEEPTVRELEGFFSEDLGYAALHTALLSLEERLIIFRIKNDDQTRLSLNPILEPVLAPITRGQGILFPSSPAPPDEAPALSGFAADGRTLGALNAFLSSQDDLFRVEGGLRKRPAEQWQALFPTLPAEQSIGALKALGLFAEAGGAGAGALRARPRNLRSFARLAPALRGAYWVGALLAFRFSQYQEVGQAPLSRVWVRSHAQLALRFSGLLDPERCYPPATLARFAILAERALWEEDAGLTGLIRLTNRAAITAFLGSCEAAGLLERRPDGAWRLGAALREREAPASESKVVMDGPFGLLLFPSISAEDALALSFFCRVCINDDHAALQRAALRFEITRESVVRGFDCGISAQAMLDLLERLCAASPDSGLAFTLRDWEKRYNQVRVFSGLVLCLAEESRYLAQTPPLSTMIRGEIAPGIYLLREGGEGGGLRETITALQKAGAPIIAQPRGGGEDVGIGTWDLGLGRDAEGGGDCERGQSDVLETVDGGVGSGGEDVGRGTWDLGLARNAGAGSDCERGKSDAGGIQFPNLGGSAQRSAREGGADDAGARYAVPITEQRNGNRPPPLSSGQQRMAQFLHRLKELHLPRREEQELASRIERRLILNEAQLSAEGLHCEKMEARGLDFAGKAMIAKRALDTGSLVEVTLSGPDGTLIQKLGMPASLDKKGGEMSLVLKTGEGEVCTIPIGRMVVIRRVRQSIFQV
jgi:hypothetical protein